jgi:RimJ/RimL family protein N-acetyltransferase
MLMSHTRIRSTEPDDAGALMPFYAIGRPRAALLDGRREPLLPNSDELRESLSGKDAVQGAFYTIESQAGCIVGFCALRGLNLDAGFGEVCVLVEEDRDDAAACIAEALAFLKERAFRRMRLRKVLALALDSERALRAALVLNGFTGCGMQREVLYANGRWHDMETLVCWAPGCAPEP